MPMRVSRIVVRDADFRITRTLASPAEMQEINALWQTLERIEERPSTNWTHKLDVEANVRSGRWLYSQEGYLVKLNYRLKPRYKIRDPERFNEVVLGF